MSAAPSIHPEGAPGPHDGSSEPESPAVAEADHPRNGAILLAAGVIIVTLLIVVIGVVQLFGKRIRREISEKQLEHESTELRTLRAEEQAKLSRYQWVSEKDGVVRLPLDRARELVIHDYANSQNSKEPKEPTP